jgi:2-polyprenyl-3-methyl-5-hydroxy-6-metoxy-1,4-benzoquinol methylase
VQIKNYYDHRETYSLDYFLWKTTKYRANRSISRSFDWIDLEGANVLDIGCGVGYYTIPISRKCACITGIDISDHNIELARQYAKALAVNNVTYIATDFLDYFSQEPFDFIYTITVLMHLKDIDQALQKINSLLKPGGILLISDLNKYFPPRILQNKKSLPIFYQTFTFSQLKRKLSDNGFDLLRESGRLYSIGGLRKPEWVVMNWMERYAQLWPIKYFGEHIALLAKKKE